MARITKGEQLRLANNFALGASFIARGDLVTARMHAEIAYKRLSLRNDTAPEMSVCKPDEPTPAKVECDWDHKSARYTEWHYCPRCGEKLEA